MRLPYRCTYLQALAPESSLHEDESPLTRRWSELEYQALWYSGAFGTSFRATNGSLIEIIQFGFWNREPGPDFVNAVILVDGTHELKGDIELDTIVTDWDHHGHGENPAFRSVVLHLFLQPTGVDFFTRTLEHREIIQVKLPANGHSLTEPSRTLAKPGACCAPLAGLTDVKVDQIIETAASLRLEKKSTALRRSIRVHGIDEALFQALAIALGYKWNKIPFLVTAQRATLSRLRSNPDFAEPILFGLSGFLEHPVSSSTQPDTYLHELWARWWRARSELYDLMLRSDLWKLGGSRPSNHPHRRLGALAQIASGWSDFRKLTTNLSSANKWFQAVSHPYWDFHYTLQSAATGRRVSLIGTTRIKDIVANVLFPLLLVSGNADWNEFRKMRSELGNVLLETVCQRLFGDPNRAAKHARFLYQQQGLLQIFEDFCLNDRSDCRRCQFPGLIAKWGD
ncbi:MAG: DUF2851 family protein [Verrucomicrobia bacterium]|nr:DUF2851 family protein [Verrucomicrobiota bacterium]MBV9272539.1 DUF2851 family protein [Verrucomicrobiota bacterium]